MGLTRQCDFKRAKMSQFVGTWKTNIKTTENYDAWAKKSGLDDKLIEEYRNDVSTEVWTKEGDNWSITSESKMNNPPKTYKFKMGVEFICNLDADGKMTEKTSSKMTGWKETTVLREVKGDKLFITLDTDGVEMKYQMDKC